MNNLAIIREALRHSLLIGIHADLPWFTTLQQDALGALDSLEFGSQGDSMYSESSVPVNGLNGGSSDDGGIPISIPVCVWPQEEECES